MSLDFDPDGPAASDGLFGLPHGVDDARVVVLPVPFEATTSYRQGTASAPQAVLAASHQVDLCDLQTGEPWRHGIALAPVAPAIISLNQAASAQAKRARDLAPGSPEADDAIRRVNQAGSELNQIVYDWVDARFAQGKIPAILGGDHAVPQGAIVAAAERFPGLGILHIDAHADLRVAYEGFEFSHASIFHNVLTHANVGPVVQVAIRDLGHAEKARIESEPRLHAWTDVAIGQALSTGTSWAAIVDQMLAPLPEHVWISFDIDGLDPSLCPNTGTPVPGGLSWRETLALLSILGQSGRSIVGFDLCEVGHAEWDATVGARLLYKLAGWAIASQHRVEV